MTVIADKVVTEGNVSLWFSSELDNYYYSSIGSKESLDTSNKAYFFMGNFHCKHFPYTTALSSAYCYYINFRTLVQM